MKHQLSRLVFKTRQWNHRRAAPGRIKAYLQSQQPARIALGSGPVLLESWLNTTLQPIKPGSVHLDVTRHFPIPDASVDYYISEHMIEHITYLQGQHMLRECFRTLRPGGRIRIATPDLAQVMSLYTYSPDAEQRAYIEWTLRRFVPEGHPDNPSFIINKMFAGWGHIFIYDERTLSEALKGAGFVDVQRYSPGESADPYLRGIEQHGKVIGNETMNRFETLILEARKPG